MNEGLWVGRVESKETLGKAGMRVPGGWRETAWAFIVWPRTGCNLRLQNSFSLEFSICCSKLWLTMAITQNEMVGRGGSLYCPSVSQWTFPDGSTLGLLWKWLPKPWAATSCFCVGGVCFCVGEYQGDLLSHVINLFKAIRKMPSLFSKRACNFTFPPKCLRVLFSTSSPMLPIFYCL